MKIRFRRYIVFQLGNKDDKAIIALDDATPSHNWATFKTIYYGEVTSTSSN